MSTQNLTEEEILRRASDERAAIVAKYDKGREEGAQIDPWEDPSYEIYHYIDRYGFVRDQRLPEKLDANETKQRHVEMEREKKWLKISKGWPKNKKSDKVFRRLYKGIPDKLRGVMWGKFLDLKRIKEEQQGKYAEMKKKSRLMSPDIRQIDLDVNRTFRDHIMFRERYGVKQQALFHVLAAYSLYNMEVGYCQGMSQIAAILLMYLDEEDAFWAMSVLMSDLKHAMHGFFIPGFPKLIRFQEHHDKILSKFLPKLKKHLDKHEVNANLYTLKWFFQCFLDRVPFTLTLRLWDIFMLEGEKVLTVMAYNILKINRKLLMRMGMEEIVNFLQFRLEKDFGFSDDVVIEHYRLCAEELQRAKLVTPAPGYSPSNELPQMPFGLINEAVLDSKIDRRSMMKQLSGQSPTNLLFRKKGDLDTSDYHSSNSHQRDSRNSYGEGSKYSYDPSVDEVGSGVEVSHRNSITETSLTSTANLSMVSNATLSHSQNACDENGGGASGSGSAGACAELGGDGRATPLSIASVNSMLAAVSGKSNRTTPENFHRQDSFYDNVPNQSGFGDQDSSEPPTPKFAGSPDAVRIFVPYQSSSTANSPSTQNGDITPTPRLTPEEPNKIIIHVGKSQSPVKPYINNGTSFTNQMLSPTGATQVSPLTVDRV
ncbi:hypothetical protein CHUAL_005524 [Chamberlinius hualienensis]